MPKPEKPTSLQDEDNIKDNVTTESEKEATLASNEHGSKQIEPPTPKEKPTKKNFWSFFKTRKGKILAAVAAVTVIVAAIFALPFTRYAILGQFVKKQVIVSAVDSTTGKPISEVLITIAGQSGKTNPQGKAEIANVPVGNHQVSAAKKYYSLANQTVNVRTFSATGIKFDLQATGRQVPIKVINKVTGNALAGATITAAETAIVTDEKGRAVIVLPATAEKVEAKIKANDYNEATAEITVTEQEDDKNTFAMTPGGKLYFLSKRTGTINVMKSNLDGSNAEVVVQGTGREEEGDTVLLASRDWKYLALKSRREGDNAKLYLIDTSTDKMSVIDEGKAQFELSGWANRHFIYKVIRTEVKQWENKRIALKSFNAVSGKIITIDETSATGSEYNYGYELLSSIYIFGDKFTYVKEWNAQHYYSDVLNDKKMAIVVVNNDGGNKKTLKEFTEGKDNYISAKLYEPNEEYFRVELGEPKPSFWEYENNTIKEAASIIDGEFSKYYPTFLVSPSGKFTFWYEPRDGKNTLFIGDSNAKDSKQIAVLSEFRPYGWFGDEYLFVSKGDSEIYIMPRDPSEGAEPIKVTDYHKANYGYQGYGYGYGGL